MCIYISSKGFYIDQRISTKFGIFFDILKEKKKKKKKYCGGLHSSIISNTIHLLLT